MKTLKSFVLLAALATLIAVGVPDALARGGGCCGDGTAVYDQTAEVRLQVIVEDVEQVHCGGGCMVGTHLMVRSGQEKLEVRLGPADFLANKGFKIGRGDALEIIGSKAKCKGQEFLLARTIKKGDQSLTLRDEHGVPAWAGWKRRAAQD